MIDDKNELINENLEQGNADYENVEQVNVEQDNGQNNDVVTQDEAVAQSNDSEQSDDTTQSDNTTLSDDKAFEDVVPPVEASTTDSTKAHSETQRIWQMQNFQNNESNNEANSNNYYKENYKKPNHKKSDVWKYALVSIVSSIVGGAILTVMLLGVAPAIQPKLKSLIGYDLPDLKLESAQPSVGELKRVEIIQSSDSAVTSVAEKVGPSVIGIRTIYQSTNDLFGIQSDGGGEGSGIIITSDGYILTNYHVIEGAINTKTRDVRNGAKIEVYLSNKIDKPYTASVKGYDSKTDLAVIKIEDKNLTAIEFGDSDTLKVGEPAIAFGNPGGLEYMGSVTAGVISGLNRTVQLEGGRKIKLIQTDAAINPGNSGGALVNIKGQLIGVNSIKMVATGFEGLGFAIPINDAKKIADELIRNNYISKPYLGISVDQSYTEEIAKANNMPMGVFVADVEILGAAQKAGIKSLDIIIKFNKKSVTSFDELEDEKNKLKPGDVVEIEIYRDGDKKTKTIQVTLGETK